MGKLGDALEHSWEQRRGSASLEHARVRDEDVLEDLGLHACHVAALARRRSQLASHRVHVPFSLLRTFGRRLGAGGHRAQL